MFFEKILVPTSVSFDKTQIWATPRSTIFLWTSSIIFSNFVLHLLIDPRVEAFSDRFFNVASASFFQYLAWVGVFRLLIRADRNGQANVRDFVASILFCAVLFLPTNRMIWLASSGLAVYMWVFASGDRYIRGAGVVLGALSVQAFWGHVLFNLLAPLLLNAEAAVIGTLLAVGRSDITWNDNVITNADGDGIIIYSGCSSFHNLSLALLCWIAFTRFTHPAWQRGDAIKGAIIAGALILLNWARLYLMASNRGSFHFWHDGVGAQVFETGTGAIVLVLSAWLVGQRDLEP
ncbi:hypothetical protein [Methylovirgula sp. 4M-Z18]|uniref:hypothetical protein n=1 Tax=Methylovirgula sp. 4M-Z18 TaxID=2293567 RepID=UPI000E2F36C6|nr:hypothetical protein [Methylovirgula sp. 4M-Z18]RFB76529.1 hypothetical protein DYH55_20560 [Methylovirgula sp. 4M-Z18]